MLGFYRSGTSLIAGLCNKLGVDFGNNYVKSAKDNPKGFFEDKELINLNIRILKEAGGGQLRPPEFEKIIAVDNEMMYNEFNHLDILNQKSSFIGIKDPRLCLTLFPLMFSIDTNEFDIHIIMVNRPHYAVWQSIETWNKAFPQLKDLPKCKDDFYKMFGAYKQSLNRTFNIIRIYKFRLFNLWLHDFEEKPEYYILEIAKFLDLEKNIENTKGWYEPQLLGRKEY